jgi:hypothetical protein
MQWKESSPRIANNGQYWFADSQGELFSGLNWWYCTKVGKKGTQQKAENTNKELRLKPWFWEPLGNMSNGRASAAFEVHGTWYLSPARPPPRSLSGTSA